jgi:hypothetical protein
MQLVELIFGKSPSRRSVTLRHAPRGVHWRRIRPRGAECVRAHIAEADHVIISGHGTLHASAGDDVIVKHEDGERAVVRRDIFDRTYESIGGGLYRKREDVVLRYFTLNRPALIETMEGPQRAEAGDWIIEGVAGELWPVARAKALEKYEPL